MRSARVRNMLVLAPIAMSFRDDGAAVAVVVDETVAVLLGDVDTVAVAVTVTVSVSLGDVEPDVRLYITSPAGMEKGVCFLSCCNNTCHWMCLAGRNRTGYDRGQE